MDWQIDKIVKESCRDNNHYGPSVLEHCREVAGISVDLARLLGANVWICWIAGNLHDIGSIENGRKDHHIRGSQRAGAILEELGYSRFLIEAVQHCIYAHRGSLALERKTLEAWIVASADALSHYKRIDELYMVGRRDLGYSHDQTLAWLEGKIIRGWAKIFPDIRELDFAQELRANAIAAVGKYKKEGDQIWK